jgi:fumarate hydratase class II
MRRRCDAVCELTAGGTAVDTGLEAREDAIVASDRDLGLPRRSGTSG